ncbi:ATP-binding protein [Spirilliplanes yamanashiensis]|uniref:histidine kinase n=1 Tax=Spirilliplanes yamanashiensis TaxID=42233 RepID=A0A8J3Y5M1_9ACTN|nr:ATP-binding protein [Spirilliplanes yamanashiensis]MDP9819252.1 signal transduction histidine kinase [Spirilliplanes yamanashiensis]GIJ01924.1 histidine kinase [Spirilliplanes yamanashiensis]
MSGLDPAELRTLFLFESLTDEQLAFLADAGRVEQHPAGATIFPENDPATCFYVLMSGTLALTRRIGQDDVETVRTDQRGVYMGATQAYLRDDDGPPRVYTATMRAVTDTTFFVLPADTFQQMMRTWFPMAIHLLEGLFFGMRSTQAIVGERQRLSALGSLTAGLMHELNNPAAAAVRATGALRQRVAGMRHKLGMLADGRIDPAQLVKMVGLQEQIIERAAKAKPLTALQASDLEDELGDWMDEHRITGGWDLAPVLAQGGIDVECLDDIAETVGPELLDGAMHWIGYALETEQLMTDIEDATERVSNLVTAAKAYSQLDRAAHQWIDVHSGLDSTLVMLGHKIGKEGVTVVKDYDRTLPQIPAHAGELNQVWTNLIDNAVQAMDGSGTLTIRTARDGDRVLVEVCDTGPGVPEELRKRVFEPFFTTKPVGAGTGLGLDISYRIVVNRHGGDLRLESAPGDTRFQVRLPVSESPSR